MKKNVYSILCSVLLGMSIVLTGCGEADISIEDVFYFEGGEDQLGNPISNSMAIFSENDMTMVNVWATYCSPCIKEMPDLNELASELAEDGIGLVGICCDVMDYEGGLDSTQVNLAKDIIAETGVTYTNVMLADYSCLDGVVKVDAVPTTFFVDKNGAVVGKVQVGAADNDTYSSLAHEALALVKGEQ